MAISRRRATPVEKNIANARRNLRQWMVKFAKDHRGCKTPRGCGCAVDKSIAVFEKAESDLFAIELASYATDWQAATNPPEPPE